MGHDNNRIIRQSINPLHMEIIHAEFINLELPPSGFCIIAAFTPVSEKRLIIIRVELARAINPNASGKRSLVKIRFPIRRKNSALPLPRKPQKAERIV
jgi:hypothetical protein